jgi:hypothetical protein
MGIDMDRVSESYKGSCHCGAVRYAFRSRKIEAGLRCNCSMCLRKGAAMTVFAIDPAQIEIVAEPGALAEYRFGSCVAVHYFCARCGIYTFHQTRRKPGWYRANLGTIEGVDPLQLPIEVVDNINWK